MRNSTIFWRRCATIRFLVVLSDSIRQLLDDYIKAVTPFLDQVKEGLSFHRRIVDAIEKKNVDSARKAMREHLNNMKRNHDKYPRIRNETKRMTAS